MNSDIDDARRLLEANGYEITSTRPGRGASSYITGLAAFAAQCDGTQAVSIVEAGGSTDNSSEPWAYVPPVRYSLTTNGHQSLAVAALGIRHELRYSAHEPGTTRGERGGGYTPYGPRSGGRW